MFRGLVLAAFMILIVGCASQPKFNRGRLRGEMGEQAEVTEEQIAKVLKLKPQLPKPFRLGIYFKEQDSNRSSSQVSWNWTPEEKQKILALGETFKKSGEASDVFLISNATISGTDLKSIRLAAAQHGADAVLVISANTDVQKYSNAWAWTYIALVPALFVPASELDALFMARAVMWDVRNEFLYMTADAETTIHQTRPAAYIDEKKATDEAKAQTVDKLRDSLAEMFAAPLRVQ